MKITGVIPDHILKLMPKGERPDGNAGRTAAEANEVFQLRNERELQKLIHNYLLQRGVTHSWSRTDKKTTNTIGWPDFVFAMKRRGGQFGFIEVKFGKGELRVEQVAVIESLKLNGADGIVARDFVAAKNFIESFAE